VPPVDRSTSGLSEEARRVIALLVARMRDVEAERARRWPDHPVVREWARERALEQRLLVPSPNWFHEVSFDLDGRIIVRLDTGNAPTFERPPNALEAHLAWQCYVPATWPELGAFAPARPADAVACPGCGGHGLHPDPEGPHANVTCLCGDAGWLPADAAGLQAFVDFAPES
jgi:hypothetical protein